LPSGAGEENAAAGDAGRSEEEVMSAMTVEEERETTPLEVESCDSEEDLDSNVSTDVEHEQSA
jgi:hypothetical protein